MDDARIRRVTVELLRPGPSHNQLLSPYTQYLGVCNDAGAAPVSVPYEQRVFDRRLKELRYETGDPGDRLAMLREMGRDMGRLLEAVPGFTGALMSDLDPGTLVHVRLTLSASELALLPFELAEVPVGASPSALSVQTRPPVSLTRHIRTVPSEGLAWPDRPRVLFVSSNPQNVPFTDHRAALVATIAPWQPLAADGGVVTADGRREQFGDLLTILLDPTLVEVQRECASTAYTHIHLLAHGDASRDLDGRSDLSYGIVLRGDDGAADVVSGERFVSAITRVGHGPTVVTLASCDSGNVGTVVAPGASFAHALHHAGLPLVIASQFPLSKDGSVPLTRRVYEGLLWGEHPLRVLHEARAALHAAFNTDWHDWASVVAYEAFPRQLDEQLDRLAYAQARRAVDAAFARLDQAVAEASGRRRTPWPGLSRTVERAMDRLPTGGRLAIESIGLRASAFKRLAHVSFALGGRAGRIAGRDSADGCDLLEQAQREYARAAKGLLIGSAQGAQQNATLHWLLVQQLSLGAALEQPRRAGAWATARFAAEAFVDHVDLEERAWAHGSLLELWLLRLAQPALSPAQRGDCFARARAHAETLVRLCEGTHTFPIESTRRQCARYVEWWGTARFARALEQSRGRQRAPSWTAPNGVLDCARQLVALLHAQTPSRSTPAQAVPLAQPKQPPASPGPPATRQGGRLAANRRSPRPTRRARPFLTVEALPAGHGDCLWIEYGSSQARHRVLIDCGTASTSKRLLARVEALPADDRFFELFVLSHIDADHIGGAVQFLAAVRRGLRFGDVWFNGWRHVSGQLGAKQGEMFSTALQDLRLPWNQNHRGAAVVVGSGSLPQYELSGGLRLTLLSPTRTELTKLKPVWTRELRAAGLEPGARVEPGKLLRGTPTTVADAAALADIDGLADAPFQGDGGAPNGTSIAVLIEYEGAAVLLAADAHAPVLITSIERLLQQRGTARLALDLFKVSHHGSQNNVSTELISLLDCPRYLISTNGDHFFHPDRQAIARILKYGGPRKRLYFNYRNRCTEVWGHEKLARVRRKYGCTVVYPSGDQPGIVVPVLGSARR